MCYWPAWEPFPGPGRHSIWRCHAVSQAELGDLGQVGCLQGSFTEEVIPVSPNPGAPQTGGLWTRPADDDTGIRWTAWLGRQWGRAACPCLCWLPAFLKGSRNRELVSGTGRADRDILLDQQPFATPDCVANPELGASAPLGPVWRSQGLEARAGFVELTPRDWLALHPCVNVGSGWAWAGASMPREKRSLELEPHAQWQPRKSLGPTHGGWTHSGCTCSGHVCE